MIDISSMVFSRVVNDAKMKEHLKGSGTAKQDKIPAFPYLYMKTLGQPTSASDLQNHQCAIDAAFEIAIYDSSSTTKVRQLIFRAAELMRQMGFTMNYGPVEVDRASTTEAYCWRARFRRTYCSGDTL